MLLPMSGIIVKAADAGYGFDFSLSYVGASTITDHVPKNTSSSVTMQCTWQALTNYINERGSNTAKINATLVSDNGYDGANFSGYWHADSDIY